MAVIPPGPTSFRSAVSSPEIESSFDTRSFEPVRESRRIESAVSVPAYTRTSESVPA